MLSVSLHEPAILKSLRETTHELSSHEMQISPEQGQLMAFLIELTGAKKTLEIGVYTGYSSLVVALALPEMGKVIACDINTETASIAQNFWQKAGVAHKIDLKLAPALETLDNLIQQGQSNRFDFIFQERNTITNNTTVGFNFCFSRSTHSDSSFLSFQVRPKSRQTRQ